MNVKQNISKLCEKFFLVPNYSCIAVWLSSLAVVSLNHCENQKYLHKSQKSPGHTKPIKVCYSAKNQNK